MMLMKIRGTSTDLSRIARSDTVTNLDAQGYPIATVTKIFLFRRWEENRFRPLQYQSWVAGLACPTRR